MSKEYKVDIKKLPKSEVEIKGYVPEGMLGVARAKAIRKLGKVMQIDGFRTGHIPEKVIIEKAGENRIMEDSAEIVLDEIYKDLINENKIDPVGHPKVTIEKLALGNPLEFTIRVAVLPEINLPKYKKIAESEMGKKDSTLEKKRASIMERLLSETKIEIPEILTESETEKTLAQMRDDVTRIGGKFEDYLVNMKKSEEDMRKELHEGSEKKAKLQLIFNKIAEIEKLELEKGILESEVRKLRELYKDAREENVHIYVATQLLNQEVMKLLEKQG